MRVAFLGLGIMGRPMASNLVKAGHEVSVWSRSGKTVDGARQAASPGDAARGAEVVWMCVSDTNAVEAILFGPQGVEESLAEGMTIVDSSTISPSATRQFAENFFGHSPLRGRIAAVGFARDHDHPQLDLLLH